MPGLSPRAGPAGGVGAKGVKAWFQFTKCLFPAHLQVRLNFPGLPSAYFIHLHICIDLNTTQSCRHHLKRLEGKRAGEACPFSLGLWKILFSEVGEGALPGWSSASPSPEQARLGDTGRSHGRPQQVDSGQGLALVVLG